jgi:hypothetical protein
MGPPGPEYELVWGAQIQGQLAAAVRCGDTDMGEGPDIRQYFGIEKLVEPLTENAGPIGSQAPFQQILIVALVFQRFVRENNFHPSR